MSLDKDQAAHAYSCLLLYACAQHLSAVDLKFQLQQVPIRKDLAALVTNIAQVHNCSENQIIELVARESTRVFSATELEKLYHIREG